MGRSAGGSPASSLEFRLQPAPARSKLKLELQRAGGPPALLLERSAVGNCSCHLSLVTGFGVCSFFPRDEEISPTPVQMAVSATLKAGKPISPPPRCCI